MSFFKLLRGPSSWIPADSSPFLPLPTRHPRHLAIGTPALFQSTAPPPEQDPEGSGSPTVFEALQEHIAILRQHLVDAGESLDSCDSEECQDLEAVLQVSRTVVQMEGTADVFAKEKLNLRNKLIRQPVQPLEEQFDRDDKDEIADFHGALGDVAGTSLQSKVPPCSGPSAAIKRSHEESPARQAFMDSVMCRATVKEGRLSWNATAMSVPPERIKKNSASASPALTAPAVASGLESSRPRANRVPAIQPIHPLDE
ncbi:hypothetical protein HPB50_021302 [Hyalomma asiaticum]|uniref:Uncharacterized protein n=1 Tax=Hyalomma asiaticum TaxID=266040 RepID=A0ACB7S7R8_HYAAI|nr:hypothetical protein HPB50_021302 [Hyalomma asiaticum]